MGLVFGLDVSLGYLDMLLETLTLFTLWTHIIDDLVIEIVFHET